MVSPKHGQPPTPTHLSQTGVPICAGLPPLVTSGGGGGDLKPRSAELGNQALGVRSVRLTIVRHGQTLHNKLHLIQGQMESDLTELGKEEAKLLGRYFARKQVKFDRVYTSDLRRSYDTCKIICDNCRRPDEPEYTPIKTAKLRERSYGIFQGLTGHELRQRAQQAGHNPEDTATFKPDGGETIGEVAARMGDFCYNDLFPLLKHLERVLIVSHGGIIREMMRMFTRHGCPIEQRDLVITPNTALNNFDVHLLADNSIRFVQARRIHKLPHLAFNVFQRDTPNVRSSDSGDDEQIDPYTCTALLESPPPPPPEQETKHGDS